MLIVEQDLFHKGEQKIPARKFFFIFFKPSNFTKRIVWVMNWKLFQQIRQEILNESQIKSLVWTKETEGDENLWSESQAWEVWSGYLHREFKWMKNKILSHWFISFWPLKYFPSVYITRGVDIPLVYNKTLVTDRDDDSLLHHVAVLLHLVLVFLLLW